MVNSLSFNFCSIQLSKGIGQLGDFYPIKIFNYESSLGLFQSVSVNYLQLHKCKPSFHWLIYIDYYGKYFEPNLHSLNSFDKEKTF